MAKIRWYKRDPVAWIQGTRKLTLEERGAYADIIELIMSHDGRLEDDDVVNAHWLICSLRTYVRIKARLISAGKLYVAGGFLHNGRCDKEAKTALSLIETCSAAGKVSGEKRQQKREKSKSCDERPLQQSFEQTKESTTREERKEGKEDIGANAPHSFRLETEPASVTVQHIEPIGSQSAIADVRAVKNLISQTTLGEAVSVWNAMAERAGLPTCQKLTDKRRKKLADRLRDAGGLSGWCSAVEKVEDIPGLRGDNDRGWRAGFDFLIEESSFTKLMEGAYDHWKPTTPRSKTDEMMELFKTWKV